MVEQFCLNPQTSKWRQMHPFLVGMQFQKEFTWGAVVRRGTGTAHQPLGVKRGCNGCENVRKHERNTHVRLRMNNKTTMNNGIADEESRTMQSSAEWKLNPQVFICILQAMDPCQIDLFATHLNHQLNRYVSW